LRHMRVSIDEATLQRIADKTGGKYFRAEDQDGLARIYAEIDKLERTQIEEERFLEYHQYYTWFVVGALALVALALALRGSVLRRLPCAPCWTGPCSTPSGSTSCGSRSRSSPGCSCSSCARETRCRRSCRR